jgi:hypothetical protein
MQFPRFESFLLAYGSECKRPVISFRFRLPDYGHYRTVAIEPSFGGRGLVFQRE